MGAEQSLGFEQAVFAALAGWQKKPLVPLLSVPKTHVAPTPTAVQSTSLAHSGRHWPIAQMSPFLQSLVRAQAVTPLGVPEDELPHAGAPSASSAETASRVNAARCQPKRRGLSGPILPFTIRLQIKRDPGNAAPGRLCRHAAKRPRPAQV